MNFAPNIAKDKHPFIIDRAGPAVKSEERERVLPKSRGLLSGAELKSGYVPRNLALDFAINRGLSLFFLVLTSPIFLFLILAQLIFFKGSIFYSGNRLGKDKELFQIYKFRTLNEVAKNLTSNRTLPSDSMTETPIGTYLRYSRLDELPQLWNILKGDMVFFGPRPIRPEMESVYKKNASSYNERFLVKPGLVGLSQAVMGHETSKRTRARFNRMCCKTNVHYGYISLFVMRVGLAVLGRGLICLRQAFRDIYYSSPEQKWMRNGFYSPKKSFVHLQDDGENNIGILTGISGSHLQFVSAKLLKKGRHKIVLERDINGRRKIRVNAILKIANGYPVGIRTSGFLHYGSYSVEGGTSDYKVERYFVCTPLLSK